jgi:hypothetical protein
MVFIGILFALFYAVILTAVFSLIFRNTGPWSGFWIFFFLLFFVSLGAGQWAAPLGPVAWGYYWVPGLFAAIIFALVLAAVSPAPPLSRKINNSQTGNNITTAKTGEEGAAAAVAVFGIFFWILMIILIMGAIAGLVR